MGKGLGRSWFILCICVCIHIHIYIGHFPPHTHKIAVWKLILVCVSYTPWASTDVLVCGIQKTKLRTSTAENQEGKWFCFYGAGDQTQCLTHKAHARLLSLAQMMSFCTLPFWFNILPTVTAKRNLYFIFLFSPVIQL